MEGTAKQNEHLVKAILELFGFLLHSAFLCLKAIYELFLPSTYEHKKNIRGEIALVTGGGGGLGRLLALRLAKLGATVVLWDINTQGKFIYFSFCQVIENAIYTYNRDLSPIKASRVHYFLVVYA